MGNVPLIFFLLVFLQSTFCYMDPHFPHYPTQFTYYVRTENEISKKMSKEQLSKWAEGKDDIGKIFIYTHGFNTANLEKSDALAIKDSVLNNKPDVGVVAIADWRLDSISNGYLYTAKVSTSFVADDVATEIQYLSKMYHKGGDDFILAGHSLGAHVMGTAAKRARDNLSVGEIGKIIGLDPAGPGFNGGTMGLQKSVAKFVLTINTSPMWGIYTAIGDKNIFLDPTNNAHIEECARRFRLLDEICKHGSVTQIYVDYIKGQEIVRSTNHTSNKDTATGPLNIFILDVSPSMNTLGRKNAMISTARSTVKSLPINSSVAVVIFGGYASVSFPPTVIKDEAMKTAALAALPTLRSSISGTSIGAGLKAGFGLMDKTCRRLNNLILLTDGEENTSPFAKDVKKPVVSCHVVNSIAVGSTADKVLEQLSTESGGKVSSVSDLSNNKQQLMDAMQSSVQYSGDGTKVSSSKIKLSPQSVILGNVTPTSFNIDQDMLQNLQFYIDTPLYKKINPVLISPGGRDFGPDCKKDDDAVGIFCDIGDTTQESGKWSLSLELPTISRRKRSTTAPLDAMVFVSSSPDNTNPVLTLSSQLSSFIVDYNANISSSVYVEALLQRGNHSVVGANVTAILISPDKYGEKITLQLRDDGAGSDVQRNDGVYSRYLSTVQLKPGFRYQVIIRAESILKKSRFRPVSSIVLGDKETKNGWEETFKFQRQTSAGSLRVINAYKKLQPARVKDFQMSSIDWERSIVSFTWTAVGNNADSGIPAGYEIMGTCDASIAMEGNYSYTVFSTNHTGNEAGFAEQINVPIPKELLSSCNGSRDLFFNIRYMNDDGKFGLYSLPASAMNLLNVPDQQIESDSGSSLIYILLSSIIGVIFVGILAFFGYRNRSFLYSKVSTRNH